MGEIRWRQDGRTDVVEIVETTATFVRVRWLNCPGLFRRIPLDDFARDWDKSDPIYKLGLALLAGRNPSKGAITKVRESLEKLYAGRPGSSLWGGLKGSEAHEELHWIIEQLR